MPKTAAMIHHDCLFNWLLQAFMPKFFAHYFPDDHVRSIPLVGLSVGSFYTV